MLLVPPPVTAAGDESETSSSFSKPTPAIKFFDQLEIYPGWSPFALKVFQISDNVFVEGSKIKHFKKIHENTGIDYTDMASIPFRVVPQLI